MTGSTLVLSACCIVNDCFPNWGDGMSITKVGGFGSGGKTPLLFGEYCPLCMGCRFVASSSAFAANFSGLKPPIKLLALFLLAGRGSGSRLLSFDLPASAMASNAWTRS